MRIGRAGWAVGASSVLFGILLGAGSNAYATYQQLSANGCSTANSPYALYNSSGIQASGGAVGAHCPFVETNGFPKSSVTKVEVDMYSSSVSGYAYAGTRAYDGSSGTTSSFQYVFSTGWNALLPDVSTIWSSSHASDYASVHVSIGNGNYFTGVDYVN